MARIDFDYSTYEPTIDTASGAPATQPLDFTVWFREEYAKAIAAHKPTYEDGLIVGALKANAIARGLTWNDHYESDTETLKIIADLIGHDLDSLSVCRVSLSVIQSLHARLDSVGPFDVLVDEGQVNSLRWAGLCGSRGIKYDDPSHEGRMVFRVEHQSKILRTNVD